VGAGGGAEEAELGGGEDELEPGAGGGEGLDPEGGADGVEPPPEAGDGDDPPPATGVDAEGAPDLLSSESDAGWGSVSETAGPMTMSDFAWVLFCRFCSGAGDSIVAKI
jgi:hypothetical protein